MAKNIFGLPIVEPVVCDGCGTARENVKWDAGLAGEFCPACLVGLREFVSMPATFGPTSPNWENSPLAKLC